MRAIRHIKYDLYANMTNEQINNHLKIIQIHKFQN